MESSGPISEIESLGDLLVGSGAQDFQELESLTNVFCPFEAIGMVRQEIRHSKYLAYLFNPNSHHGFGDTLLNALLLLIAENSDFHQDLSRLDIHLANTTNATVKTEWKNIDLLIELATPPDQQNIVFAIELKIDAKESETQLKKYERTITHEYKNWKHVFVFLTKSNDEARDENNEIWMPLGLENLIGRLQGSVKNHPSQGPAVDQFHAYVKMLRKHIVPNRKLEKLVKKIWAKHSSALEVLIEHRPDALGSLFDELAKRHDEFAKKLSEATGLNVSKDKSSKGILRFTMDDWIDDNIPKGQEKWSATNAVFVIVVEKDVKKGRLNTSTSLVLLPIRSQSLNSEQNFQNSFLARIVKNAETIKKLWPESSRPKIGESEKLNSYTHLSKHVLLTGEKLEKDTEDNIDFPTIADTVFNDFISAWEKILPEYDKIVKEFQKGG